ncbi:hypothetical protein OS493_002554 [Desmophyllum pertusum]|uniref:Alpha-and gamma-adaptin-binding protein p34 n=1 Tax=Desmophyllum pertusum TaxID=174260 RepID=A0A9X0CP42_9CNID|nr:hypothetical protein OS493_002554 [Desmophyllum pertusum]
MADNIGRVLVVSCSSFLSPKDVISEMCRTECSVPTELPDGSLSSYLWRIENKYFTADVGLCACSVSSLPPQCEFAVNMNFQSVIIVFDQKEKASFKEVTSWLPYIKTQDPSVLLLLNSGKGGSSAGISKAEVVKWCLDNSFELIEMISEEDEEEDEGDEFREKIGIERVVEALQCAEWPNMKMTENRSNKGPKGCKEDQGANALLNNEEKQSSENEQTPVLPLPTDDLELLSTLASDGTENESFEELFQKLAVMKERASTLPANERKDYAEKVAIAFWRAMGGSEEEIAGLGGDGDS